MTLHKSDIIRISVFTLFIAGSIYGIVTMLKLTSTEDKIFPVIGFSLMILFCILAICRILYEAHKLDGNHATHTIVFRNYKRTGLVVLCMIAYTAFIYKVDFLIGTILFAFLASYIWGNRKWTHLIVYAVCVGIFLYVIFPVMLKVPMPAKLW